MRSRRATWAERKKIFVFPNWYNCCVCCVCLSSVNLKLENTFSSESQKKYNLLKMWNRMRQTINYFNDIFTKSTNFVGSATPGPNQLSWGRLWNRALRCDSNIFIQFSLQLNKFTRFWRLRYFRKLAMRANAKNSITISEVSVTPSRREPIGTDPNRLQHSTGPQLLNSSHVIELEGHLIVIRFNTSDIMGFRCVQSPHQSGQWFSKLGSDRCFCLFWLFVRLLLLLIKEQVKRASKRQGKYWSDFQFSWFLGHFGWKIVNKESFDDIGSFQ